MPDFLDQTVQAQPLEQTRELSAGFPAQVGTEGFVLEES